MSDVPEGLADGVQRRLDPRYVDLQQQVGWIVAGVVSSILLIGLAVFALATQPGVWVLLAALAATVVIIAGLVWLAVRWPSIEYERASYVLDDRGLEIRRGVVWRRVINVPRSRVQHTDVSQGPLERSHGLGTLVVYTAGTAHAQVDLPGLEHATALRIRDHLLPRELADAV